jgi:hypothetical protein
MKIINPRENLLDILFSPFSKDLPNQAPRRKPVTDAVIRDTSEETPTAVPRPTTFGMARLKDSRHE